jgi:hypothetical protein
LAVFRADFHCFCEYIVFVFLSVLTTIKTSALSVEQVDLGLWILKQIYKRSIYFILSLNAIIIFFKIDFPAVTVCGSGRIMRGAEEGFYSLFIDFLDKEKNISVQIPAMVFAGVLREEVSMMKHILIIYTLYTTNDIK